MGYDESYLITVSYPCFACVFFQVVLLHSQKLSLPLAFFQCLLSNG